MCVIVVVGNGDRGDWSESVGGWQLQSIEQWKTFNLKLVRELSFTRTRSINAKQSLRIFSTFTHTTEAILFLIFQC